MRARYLDKLHLQCKAPTFIIAYFSVMLQVNDPQPLLVEVSMCHVNANCALCKGPSEK